VNLDQDTVESTIQIFQMAVPYFVPEVELTLDQYVLQGVKPVISRLEIAFDLETTLLGENPLSMSGDTTAIEVDVVAALSGYDGVYVIEIPADAISVSSVSDIKP